MSGEGVVFFLFFFFSAPHFLFCYFIFLFIFYLCLSVKFGEAFFYAIPELNRPLGFVFFSHIVDNVTFEFGGGVGVFCNFNFFFAWCL
jgi:hypothetical protein